MGPRRVGKTVMIMHSIQKLMDNGVSPQNIIYVSIDNLIYKDVFLEDLFLAACSILGKDPVNDEMYVFYDEVQYLKDWEVHLKCLVDTYFNAKFVVSGSSAAVLKMKSGESGAGRFIDFLLPPLTFYEYIQLKNLSSLIIPSESERWVLSVRACGTTNIKRLNELFIDYINYGGFPEVAFSCRRAFDPGLFFRHDIIDKVLLRDLPSLYGINNVQELNDLLARIAYHSGTQFSYDALSKESGVNKETLRKYVEYLEAAFLIKVARRSDDTAKSYRRDTQFKLYLTNPSLRCALFEPVRPDGEEIGNMVETAVFAQWIPRLGEATRYANWRQGRKQGEVDMVGLDIARQKPKWAVEIKWSDRFFDHPQDLDSLEYFMERNKIDTAVVTSITKHGEVEFGGRKLLFIPTACYCYTVGENLITQGKSPFEL